MPGGKGGPSSGKKRKQRGEPHNGGDDRSAAASAESSLLANPYVTIQNNARNYEEVSHIGTGAYGTVFKARDRANEGQFVALKKVRVPLTEEGVPMNTLREIALLKQLETFEHPNIVRLLDICHGRRLEQEQQLVLFLVFEYIEQDLATYMEKCPPPGIDPAVIQKITYQLIRGVDFLHSNRIIHRDLKPQNILITDSLVVKLADFGLARIYEYNIALTPVVVTLWYRSPEVLMQTSYGSAVDIWSCGCIFAELYRRQPLFCGQSDGDQLGKVLEVIGSPEESEWPKDVSLPWSSFQHYKGMDLEKLVSEMCQKGLSLLKKMLIFDPAKRITAAQALTDEYFSDCEDYFSGMKPAVAVKSVPTSTATKDISHPGTSSRSSVDK